MDSFLRNFPDQVALAKVMDYGVFLAIVAVIFSLLAFRGNYILAPPYAVSAYIMVFQRKAKNASRINIFITYAVVILSSDLLHLLVGSNLGSMLANVVIVSAFITFTKFTHPPAIALTIFSYIAGDPLDFTISSVLALIALMSASFIMEKYG